jgi:hypothetical protein
MYRTPRDNQAQFDTQSNKKTKQQPINPFSNNKIHIKYTPKPGNTGINNLFGLVTQQS